jgi:class 3 adenylate cyclase
MTTGQLPFVSDTPMVTMLMHLREQVPDATKLNPELPPEMDKVLQKAMAKEPADRYQSMGDFLLDTSRLLGGVITGAPTHLRLATIALIDRRQSRAERKGSMPSRSASQSTPTEQNKPITVVYANAAEYAEIVDLDNGPEAARRAMSDLWKSAAGYVYDFGGVVFTQSERDMMALWGADVVREDDPDQAIKAALAIQESIGQRTAGVLPEEEPLPIRIGINTGLALLTISPETRTYTAGGVTISLASRVADIADGLVLITHNTFREVQGIFDIEPDAPVRVRRAGGRALIDTYRVISTKPRAFRLKVRGVEGVDTRMIGRRAELEQLQKAFFNAVEDSETQMVTIVGEPGIGKSRLLFEFASWAELRPEMYYIFRVRATPAMTSRPYALWRELFSFRFEILDSDSQDLVREKMETGVADLIGPNEAITHLIGHLVGFNFGDSPYLVGEPQVVADQARKAVGQFFSRLSQEDPIVFQLEDLQHVDDASLDLLAELVGEYPNLPLLVVGTARSELYDHRPAWGSGQDFHSRVELRTLDKRDSRDLVAEILCKADELPRNLRDLIVDQAEGNPYYMEELVKMLIEDRVIQKLNEQQWTVEISRLERLRVPRTLVGLLQARFDSLLYPEKLLLQRAAVIGRVFHDKALLALDASDETHVDDQAGTLKRLVDREFIYARETSAFADSRE